MRVGRISSNFTIMLEVQPPDNSQKGATVAFDNIHLIHCYQENDDTCSPMQYKCKTTETCINNTSICDITKDCPYGDDETQNCGELVTHYLSLMRFDTLKWFIKTRKRTI